MDLLLLGLVLLAGGLLGWFLRNREGAVALNRQMARLSLWSLLFVMGSKLAAHRELFAKDVGAFGAAIASSLLLGVLYFVAFLMVARIREKKSSSEPLQVPVRADNPEPAPTVGHDLLGAGLNAGCILGGFLVYLLLPRSLAESLPISMAADGILRALLLFIGFDLGVEMHRLDRSKLPAMLLVVPFLNIAFSLGCGALFGLLTRFSLREGLLIHAGLGWYSLSSVLLAERGLVLLSILAFIHNVFRELFSILTVPLAARISPYLPIYLAGATSMDVMLPFVQRYCGPQYTLVSFYSGMVCSLAVLPLVRLLAG